VWNEAVFGKGLTFDFFSDPLVSKVILVTAQCADSIITCAFSIGKDTLQSRPTLVSLGTISSFHCAKIFYDLDQFQFRHTVMFHPAKCLVHEEGITVYTEECERYSTVP